MNLAVGCKKSHGGGYHGDSEDNVLHRAMVATATLVLQQPVPIGLLLASDLEDDLTLPKLRAA